ncbi:hypothetical protein MFS40622_0898 [Methanocaldococcus sp. FS406-22]|uniref:DUF6079 family protein n=1 Tax=Methanocaldococcus sp. (strain FS406-22) TaxID=644281 RepID=UPI0001BF53C4|nr:DUF6079 family protein [Methanocaldococcus sp. FS406-22]ADC69580.1 hypothetical protein MFS40622_0898 [Methanocaldococcus sp. FS406-22]
MVKVKELFNFQEIRPVIQVVKDDPKELVSTFVVSDKMKKDIELIVQNLNDIQHRSIFIIGDYGTGKSHFLGFIVNIAGDKSLIDYIQDEDLKKYLKENLEKDFIIVVYELNPIRQPFGLIFYLIMQMYLEKNYGIKINVPKTEEEFNSILDHKQYIIDNIIKPVKEKFPDRGIIVAFDELSDFLRQKHREDVNQDMQFIRILGELSEKEDIIFIFSMQENIFRSPLYVDQADAVSRVYQRYHIIEITKEDVEKVLAQRIVPKTPAQIAKLRELLSQYKKYYEDFEGKEDEFIELYPIHPSVLHAFRQLPYFQKRGILKFAMDKIKEILDKEFPAFVTMDSIFDEIYNNPTISNTEEVREVLDVVERLLYKIQSIPALRKDRDIAERIIKSLAVYKLMKPEEKPTPYQIAYDLMVLPRLESIEINDYILGIIKRIRRETAGQFLGYDEKEKKFYIDLERKIDYDEIINRKISIQSNDDRESYLFEFLRESLELSRDDVKLERPSIKIFRTTAFWESRKGFRNGFIIFEGKNLKNSAKEYKNFLGNDFAVVVVSPYKSESIFEPSDATILIKLKIKESEENLKRYSAIKALIGDRQYVNVMKDKLATVKRKLVDELTNDMLNSVINYNGKNIVVGDLVGEEVGDIYTIIEKIKSKLLEDYFSREYSEYPKFSIKITPENIEDVVKRVLEDILASPDPENYRKDTIKILSDLGLYSQGKLKITDNPYISKIQDLLSGKTKDFKSILEKMSQKPYGIQKEISYIFVSVLLINDEIELKKSTKDRIGPLEIRELLKKKGLSAFDIVKYIEPVSEFPVNDLQKIFDALELDSTKIRIKNQRLDALKDYKFRVSELEDVIKKLNDLQSKIDKIKNLGFTVSEDKIQSLLNIANNKELLNKLKEVNSLHDFNKIHKISPELIKEWRESIEILGRLTNDLEKIIPLLEYAKSAKDIIDACEDIFSEIYVKKLNELYEEVVKIIESDKLLDIQHRLPIPGKLEEFKRLYIEAYAEAHKRYFEKEEWKELNKLLNSETLKELKILSQVRCINGSIVEQIENEIYELLKKRCNITNPEQHLTYMPVCYCGFPRDSPIGIDLSQKVQELSKKIDELRDEWERVIIEEIKKVQDKIEFLKPNEKDAIEDIIAQNSLGEVDRELVSIINKLFEDFQVVEIRLEEFYEWLGEGGYLLTPEELKEKFEEFIKIKVPKGENVRVKIVK